MGERITIVLEEGISEKLVELSGSSRKQGEFLSNLIKATWENRHAVSEGIDIETVRYQVMGLTANLKQVEGRLLHVERNLAAMIAQGQKISLTRG